jgi:uncharacterized protein YbaA (DUF1428 family)
MHMNYVDGFVLPVPRKNIQAYRRLTSLAGKVWREHGAPEYIECVADDVKPGKVTSFPQSVKLKRGETVVFSWIVYKSRAHRPHDGCQSPALRRQAHVLGWIQGNTRRLRRKHHAISAAVLF